MFVENLTTIYIFYDFSHFNNNLTVNRSIARRCFMHSFVRFDIKFAVLHDQCSLKYFVVKVHKYFLVRMLALILESWQKVSYMINVGSYLWKWASNYFVLPQSILPLCLCNLVFVLVLHKSKFTFYFIDFQKNVIMLHVLNPHAIVITLWILCVPPVKLQSHSFFSYFTL